MNLRDDQFKNAPLLSTARFGLGFIATLCMLAIMTILLYLFGLKYFAILTLAVGILIFAAKSMEVLQLRRPEERRIIGSRCLVIKQVCSDQKGVVKLYLEDNRLDPEMWSAESARGDVIEEGEVAKIVGMRSIVLLIEAELSE